MAIFGAPIFRENDAQRAVACALEMQLAMEDVNAQNREAGYPTVSMGIGINTGELVVGNVGSHKRTKYGVVGRNVNLTSRIESYTVGGQVFVSQSTVDACGDILRIDKQIEVMPKGVIEPIHVYDIGGIGGEFNIVLPQKDKVEHVELGKFISIQFTVIEKKHTGEKVYPGTIIKLVYSGSTIAADIQAACRYRRLMNLRLTVFDGQGHEISHALYGKIVEIFSESPPVFRVSFTSVPPEVRTFFAMVCESQGMKRLDDHVK
jgi:adenylate cyclase